MRLLVVAATEREIAPLASSAHAHRGVDFLVTGVGMVGTAARVSRALVLDTYDAALNFGVCGSFNPRLPPGTVVHVASDRIAELGAEDGDAVLSLQDIGLAGDEAFTSKRAPASQTLASLTRVAGITVNTVHGTEASIARAIARFHPDVESMEGAAFMCACSINGVPYAQVRAVSNLMERRNRSAWKIDLALENLTRTASGILGDLL